MPTASELTYQTNANAMQMAQTIFGDGTTVVSASYSGWSQSSGVYSNGDTIAPGVTPSDTGVILSTGRASHFTNSSGDVNDDPNTSTNTPGVNNDPQFNAAAGTNTFDAAILDVDFIPDASTMTMQFVFASEEYPEFQNSVYQDFVGVWINGQQVDLVVGNGDTDPGNVNSTNNQNLYVDNTGDAFNTEMDGFTVTMTLTIPVNPGVVNSIRIGVADVADSSYDSNLLIAADSLQTDLIAHADSASVFVGGSVNVDVLGNDTNVSGGTLTITHINGQPVTAGSTITLNTGQMVPLNANGTLTYNNDLTVGDVNFTYTVDNGANVDTGFVNVSSVPCFVAGTLISTPRGEIPVERLRPGDLVETRDDGPQPLRWIGGRTVAAQDMFAPVRIRAGTFGNHRMLMVSPEHRILVRDSTAELLFGDAEVLIAAKDLVNGRSVRWAPGGEVTYVHLMFDQHQVVFSEGLETESFLPGPQTAAIFDKPVLDEICAIFPQLDPHTGEGYSPAARRTLRRFEAQLLMAQTRVLPRAA